MINAAQLVGTHDVLFLTLDSLRYDVAVEALEAGETPAIASVLPFGKWELRHTPGSFTYAAHHAFFAGFLPTPVRPGLHPRLFAAKFTGSETTTDHTAAFDTPDWVSGFASRGYHTICIGGVGFFNKQTELGRVLPNMFAESHWSSKLSVTCNRSTENQVRLARSILDGLPANKRALLFINISAIHQPNCIFSPGAIADDKRTMRAALRYVDSHLGKLFDRMARRAPTLTILRSDHGSAYGEDGYRGHRIAHRTVWDVPYAEFVLERR